MKLSKIKLLTVLLAASLTFTATSFAEKKDCSRLTEVQPLINAIHEQIRLNNTNNSVDMKALDSLYDKTLELDSSITNCGDDYHINLLDQIKSTLLKIEASSTPA